MEVMVTQSTKVQNALCERITGGPVSYQESWPTVSHNCIDTTDGIIMEYDNVITMNTYMIMEFDKDAPSKN